MPVMVKPTSPCYHLLATTVLIASVSYAAGTQPAAGPPVTITLRSPLTTTLYMTDDVSLNVHCAFREDAAPPDMAAWLASYSMCLSLRILEPDGGSLDVCEPLQLKTTAKDAGNVMVLGAGSFSFTKELQGFATYGCATSVNLEVWIRSSSGREETPPVVMQFSTCSNDQVPPRERWSCRPEDLIVSLHPFHDAHIAVLRGNGTPLFVLELERLARERYFRGLDPGSSRGGAPMGEHTRALWRQASELVQRRLTEELNLNSSVSAVTFHTGVYNPSVGQWGSYYDDLSFICGLFPAAVWVQVNHHGSHAALGLWDAHDATGLRRPLILSYDGGGNDGVLRAFAGNVDAPRAPLTPLQGVPQLGLGARYSEIASLLPEVNRGERHCGPAADRARFGSCAYSYNLTHLESPSDSAAWLALSGKLMGCVDADTCLPVSSHTQSCLLGVTHAHQGHGLFYAAARVKRGAAPHIMHLKV